MPHPDDVAGHWAFEDSAVSGGPVTSRRERNRLSSVQARKKAKLERDQIELNLARFQAENRALRELSLGAEQRPCFDQFLIDDLLDSFLFPSSKSRTSSIRKCIVQMLTNLSLVGRGVQNAFDANCKELDEICLTTAAAVADVDAVAAAACEDARRDLERARDLFHIHGEALRLITEHMRSALKEEQQARVVIWAHEHADLVYQARPQPSKTIHAPKQPEQINCEIDENETENHESS